MLDHPYPKVQPGPPRPSQVYRPVQFSMPQGTERYVVEGNGAVLIPVEANDQITLINTEGGQACEIVATGSGGLIDASVIGTTANGSADGLRALLTSSEYSLRGMRMGLEARGINLGGAQAVHLFDAMSAAKAEETFRVQRDGAVIIAAPGGPMDAEAQDTTTPIAVMVKRAIIKSHTKFEAPEPLADPVADIRVHTQTAEAFFRQSGRLHPDH